MSTPDEQRTELGPPCSCTFTEDSILSEREYSCDCSKDEHDIVVHKPDCDLFRNETLVFPDEVCECGIRDDVKKTGRDVCVCELPEGTERKFPCECDLPDDVGVARHVCKCYPPEGSKEAFVEWRKNRKIGAMPAVLDATHPLMQRFQQTLREFLLKENAVAEEEILCLKDELRLNKEAYQKDLEEIYKHDHDCNAQRVLIEEYETTLVERTAARQQAQQQAKEVSKRQKQTLEQLDQDMMIEREAREEMECLTALCQQLERWREETASELTVSRNVSEKMQTEKRALTEQKREMDVTVFWLTNEVWKLESELEMFRKQFEIKSFEMDKINDKVTAYAAELEDLDLDKRRLVSLWNDLLNNISRRDKVFDSVREDYVELQNNFHTLIITLDITKKANTEEMHKGKELAMIKEKIVYDTDKVTRLLNKEEQKRAALESENQQLTESIEITDKDIEMMKMENYTLRDTLKSLCKEFDHKVNKKLKLENDILANLQECLLNNKAVEYMANGIKNMREMTRKQELALVAMENQHAKLILDLEVGRNLRKKNEKILQKTLATVRQKEKELYELEEKYQKKDLVTMKKTRELDIIVEKYVTLKKTFDAKTPQQLRIELIEKQTKDMRVRMRGLQQEWLREQGHVVKLTEQYQRVNTDINLINKQLQICEQKCMRIQADEQKVIQEKLDMERTLREMRDRLQVLERTRKEAQDRNNSAQKHNISVTQEYDANLKGEEMKIIELEDEIEAMDTEKINLTEELDRVQREALIWQRKGILAVELRKNMKEAKSAAGEIGKMKNEIHRMEAHREQLRRTGEKLSEELAHCVKRREAALEKTRASAAVEKAYGKSNRVSPSAYRHKLRLWRSNVANAVKQLSEAEAVLKQLHEDGKRLECDISDTKSRNAKLEERIASLIRECGEAKRQQHWLLERVVRSQRLGSELTIVVKRQSLAFKKPKSVLMKEYKDACELNDRLKYVVQCLAKEYPHIGDKLAMIANTLDIHSPSGSPRLAEPPSLCNLIEGDENVANNQQRPSNLHAVSVVSSSNSTLDGHCT